MRRLVLFLFLLLAFVSPVFGDDLLILSGGGNQFRRYDETGAFVGTNGDVFRSQGFDRAADGTLYVGSHGAAQLLKLDAAGNVLLAEDIFPRPQRVRVGPDGLLYVNITDQSILRVNPTTLLPIDPVSPTAAAFDLEFAPNGTLWATTHGAITAFDITNDTQIDFDPSTPAIDPFATAFSPSDIEFGPDGNLYVINFRTIQRYDLETRALLGDFVPAPPVSSPSPVAMAFGPGGDLFVGMDNSTVVRYDGDTGALLGTFVNDANMGSVVEMLFVVPEPGGIGLVVAGAIFLVRRRSKSSAR
jgi:sugar lactone lactonase YvrE